MSSYTRTSLNKYLSPYGEVELTLLGEVSSLTGTNCGKKHGLIRFKNEIAHEFYESTHVGTVHLKSFNVLIIEPSGNKHLVMNINVLPEDAGDNYLKPFHQYLFEYKIVKELKKEDQEINQDELLTLDEVEQLVIKPKDNKTSLHSTIWKDETTDTIYIKAKISYTNILGKPSKKGIIIQLREEQLSFVPEGSNYPITKLK